MDNYNSTGAVWHYFSTINNVLSRGAMLKMAEKNPLNLIWIMPAKGREKKGFDSCSRSLFYGECSNLLLQIAYQKNIFSCTNK